MQAGLVQQSPIRRALSYFRPEARAEFIPPSDRKIICDISGWNGDAAHPVNFAVMATRVAGVYIKATQGVSGIDDQFALSRDGADGVIPFGLYHFVTTQNGVLQADHFLGTVGGRLGVLPVVLDVEQQSLSAQIVKDCAQRIEERTGALPLIYTSVNFWGKVYSATAKTWVSDHCPLWVAHWGTEYPSIPYGWTSYVIHQYTADGVGVEYGTAPPPYADDDIDLSYCRADWLAGYTNPAPTLEERVSILEDAARDHGWDV